MRMYTYEGKAGRGVGGGGGGGGAKGGGRLEKSVLRYVCTKWMTPNKCGRIFFVHWYGQVH